MKPPGPVLSDAAVKAIYKAVANTFLRVKNRFLGTHQGHKKLVFGHIAPTLSLQGLYEAANREEGSRPDLKTFHQLVKSAVSYLDAVEARTQAQVVKEVGSFLHDAHNRGVKTDIAKVLGGKLIEVMDQATVSVKRIIDTEAQNAKNIGVLEGISRINASQGIDDPVVYFVSVNDKTRCSECTRLHCMSDGLTPRLWKLSEVGAGYHKKGESNPKLGGLHPNCRCTLAGLSLGYGFVGGRIAYIAKDHDEYSHQHDQQLNKFEDLQKSYSTHDFVRQLGDLGWKPNKVTKEHYFEHPTVTQGAFNLEGRTRQLVLGHDQQHTVPDYKVKAVLGDAGLQVINGKMVPKQGHPYYKLYQASGHAPLDPSQPKTWIPPHHSPDMKSVPIHKLLPTKEPMHYLVGKYSNSFKTGQPVPHVEAVDAGDGNYLIESGEEAHEAAKQHGMTHVPVKIVG